jgi:hypothetical protein
MHRRAIVAAVALLAASPALADDSKGPPSPAPQPPPQADAGKGRMFDPRFREGAPTDVLVAGTVPLTRGVVDTFVDLVESVHDVALSAAEEQTIRDGLETAWPKLSEDEQRWYDRQVAARDRLRASGAPDPAATRAFVDAFRAALDARVAKASAGAWESAIRRAIERKSSPFSVMPMPQVSVADLDAFEELVVFLVGVARNSEAAPTEGQRIAVRPSVRRAMDQSGPTVRRHYARMHRLWPLVKARWDASSDEQRLRFRLAVLRLFRRIMKLSVPPVGTAIDLPGYAASAAEVASTMNAADAYTSAFANPGDVITTTVEGLGMAGNDLEPVFAYDRLWLR